MTDLERARALIQYWKDCEQYVGQHMSLSTNFETLVPLISAALAASRREGYDEAVKTYVGVCQQVRKDGAEEMREQAAQWFDDRYEPEVAAFIRALPLTPKEPT